MIEPLYRRVLGPDFDLLPPAVRRLHSLEGPTTWQGRADVDRGSHPLCQMVALATGLPPAGREQPLTVAFTPQGDAEIWERRFGTRLFRSRQSAGRDGAIDEAIGPTRVVLVPKATANGLTLEARALEVLGLPMPGQLVPRVRTREWEVDGRYRFEIESEIAGLGRLVAYRGWLEPGTGP